MSGTNELEILKRHIRELSAEINSLKSKITPYLTPKEYMALHSRFLNLSNLKAIAKNELDNRLHYYKITLRGKKKSDNEVSTEKTFRRKLTSEIDYKFYSSGSQNISAESEKEMFAQVKQNYSRFFADGKFSIQRIVKIR